MATKFSGLWNATDFAYGIAKNVPGLGVISGPATTGAGTLTLAFASFATSDGFIVSPLNTNAPVIVGGDSAMETQTPSAVSTSTPLVYGSSSLTYTNWTYVHGMGDTVRSGTVGLQEALNYVSSIGGGIVMVDKAWYNMGGSSTILAAATVPTGVSIWDVSAGAQSIYPEQTVTVAVPNAKVLTLSTVGMPLIAAPGAGNLIVVDRLVVEQVAKTAAFAGSPGVLTAAYGTQAAQVACTGSIAATVLTAGSGTTNQIGMAMGIAPANAASTTYLNSPVGLYVATNDPTTGGGSLIVEVQYRILGGF
jgi:hypothetical protein